MSNVIINFNYNGKKIKLNCNNNEDLKDIFKRYSIMIKKNLNTLNFLINGNLINKLLKLKEINNRNNKNNFIDILVIENNNYKYNDKSFYLSQKKILTVNNEDESINLYNYNF